MDRKDNVEARRRKILDNAEARLRFIKEGIPWRTEIDTREEVPTELNENSQETLINEAKDREKATVDSFISDECNTSSYLPETKTQINSDSNVKCVNPQNTEIPNDLINFSNHEVDTSKDESFRVRKRNDPSSSSKEPLDKTGIGENKIDYENVSKRKSNEERNSDPFKNIKALLTESSDERKRQEKKISEQNRFLWISCLIMLCLGILVRIAYAIGLSWIFNEMMLVPFVTVATPRMVLVAWDPPTPSGAIVQALIMSGVKVKIINKAYTLLALFRTFLQLFSVYLVSFLFIHQIVQTMFQEV